MRTTEDHAASINVLDNDLDYDTGDTLHFAGFKGSVSTLPGTFETNANGTVTFTPSANYNGSFTVEYYVADSTNLTDLATITVTVSAVNDAPVALDAEATTPEDTAKTIDVSSRISDVDVETNGDVLVVSVAEDNGPAHGTYSLSGTQITYTPQSDFNGSDQIIYTVTDSLGESDTGTISITISAVNDKPVASDDSTETQEDTRVTINVLENDSDVDINSELNALPDDALTIASVGAAAHGATRIEGVQITYEPDENFNGSDSFVYTVSDGTLSDTARVSVSIAQVNDGILAQDDETSTTDEDPVAIDVLANDTDADTDEATNLDALHSRDDFRLTAVGAASNGTTKIENGKITYTPFDRFAGEDSFTYTVADGHGTSDTATVTVTVLSVNDAPMIIEFSKPAEGTKAIPPDAISVVWTAFDIDGDTLTYSLEYFDGKDWLPAASGLSKAEYAFAIPATLASTSGLKFRVTANDGSLTSEYGYSGAVKVDKDAPTGSVVSMRTADGRAYTAGTWTNQNVTVQASSAQDASTVVYYYAMDGAAEEAGDGMTVTGGVRTVSVIARDEFGNQTALGGYLARVDKQPPAVPQMRESISGANVIVSFSLQADPGGSGNDYLILPDGSTLNAGGTLQFATAKNGTYSFTLVDVAGNRRTFSYTVSSADTTKPLISYASGAYRVGTSSLENISVTLTFSDSESAIVARGYQLSTSASANGAYRSYSGTISIDEAGTYYIHAFARNAFDNTAYQTFGPFILVNEAATLAGATPMPEPRNGSVVVTREDVEEIPGETVAIRLPGKEWSETLTLEDVTPGDYLVEVMDADGNVRTVTVHVTAQDIIARSLKSGDSPTLMIALAIAAAAGLLLLLLFAGYNVIVTVINVPFTQEKKIRAMRRIMFAREEFVIKLEQRHIQGGRFARIKIAKHLTKKLRGSWIIVQLQGAEVLREQVPEDANEPFRRKITLE
ncbi:MAG: tandem-95 repeat protein [Alphaproteobacteria bacterium]|nr:tandem-95 repeat protein [Alphaproteobacteria bacterium]